MKDGVSCIASGALDGGVYLDGAVKNVASIGIPLEHAFMLASRTPTERMGLADYGKILLGCPAYLVGWNKDLCPVLIIVDHEMQIKKRA